MRLRNIPGSWKLLQKITGVFRNRNSRKVTGTAFLKTAILFILKLEWARDSF